MNVSFYQAAAAMGANARWQEIISGNLAAASVPGYKKQELSFSAVQAGLMPQHELNRPGLSLPFVLPQTASATNFSPGELKPTGQKTDVAIEGAGFFEVQLPGGSRAYTRDGEFQLNATGQLVTKRGYPVMSDGGPVQLDLASGPMEISADGTISQGGQAQGILKAVTFANPGALTQLGAGLFEARAPGLQPVPSPDTRFRQGWIEGGNTSAPAEMADLITAMRSFETNQRVVQLQDERMGRVISELGNTNG